jgi:hypothetical protein
MVNNNEDPAAEDVPALDSQQVEILGRNRIKAALIEAGLEVATPERDNGVDLIVYRWSAEPPQFTARPLQIKAARDFSFGIDAKYRKIPNLIMAFVVGVREEAHAIYAMTYPELLGVADALGWTKTPSWIDGESYSTRHESKRLSAELARFRATRQSWARFFEAT